MIISMASLAATVLVSLLGRGFLRLVPILCGITVGFGTALWLGVGGWDKVLAAPWLALPAFTFPEFSLEPILFIIPITLAPAIEHFGDIIAISSVTGRDYLKDPGIKIPCSATAWRPWPPAPWADRPIPPIPKSPAR